MPNFAIIGDMHMQFDETDVAFFNTSDYDALLFVGDLASKNPDSMFRLLPIIEQLTKPAFLIPGNHDTTGIRQLLGELMHSELLIENGAASQFERMQKLQAGLKRVQLCGYSNHQLPGGVGLVAARPFSMGDANAASAADHFNLPVNFRPFVAKKHGVSTLGESLARLKSLINEIDPPYLILAHHGPHGLGQLSTDMWGADFLPQETDFGDHDLAAAVTYAQSIGKPPLAVIAGHMHYPTKHGKKPKQWHAAKGGVTYINAARWPRIFKREGRELRHHVRLTIEADGSCGVVACYVSGAETFVTSDDRAVVP